MNEEANKEVPDAIGIDLVKPPNLLTMPKVSSSTLTMGAALRTSSDHTYLSADGARVSFITAK